MSKSKLQNPVKIELKHDCSLFIRENHLPISKINIDAGKAHIVNKYNGEVPCLVKIGRNSSLKIEGICFELSQVILDPGTEFHFTKNQKDYSILRNPKLYNQLVITDMDSFIKEYAMELSGNSFDSHM